MSFGEFYVRMVMWAMEVLFYWLRILAWVGLGTIIVMLVALALCRR